MVTIKCDFTRLLPQHTVGEDGEEKIEVKLQMFCQPAQLVAYTEVPLADLEQFGRHIIQLAENLQGHLDRKGNVCSTKLDDSQENIPDN